MGKRFVFGNMSDDWDRLITVLINETLASSGGTAKGKKQHTYSYLSPSNMGSFGRLNEACEENIPVSDDPRGISTLFFTPENS